MREIRQNIIMTYIYAHGVQMVSLLLIVTMRVYFKLFYKNDAMDPTQ